MRKGITQFKCWEMITVWPREMMNRGCRQGHREEEQEEGEEDEEIRAVIEGEINNSRASEVAPFEPRVGEPQTTEQRRIATFLINR